MRHAAKQAIAYIDRHIFAFGFILTTLYLIAVSFQGIDVCDEGWSATFYQNIFSHPESCQYQFAFYTSGIVGGVLNELIPTGGIFMFRLASVVVMMSCFTLSYKLLRPYFKPRHIVVGLMMVTLNFDYGIMLLHHNYISALVTLCVVVCLIHALTKSSRWLIGVSGILLALDIFARIPNLTMLILGLLIILWSVLQKRSLRQTLLDIAWFAGGVILGVGLVVGLMYCLGHLDIFFDSLSGIVNKGQAADSNHGFAKLASAYIYNYKMVITAGVWLTCACLSFKAPFKVLQYALSAIFAALTAYFIYNNGYIYVLYALSFMAMAFFVLSKNQRAELKLIVTAAFLIMVFQPLGSDLGIDNYGGSCLWLCVPITIGILLGGSMLHPLTKFGQKIIPPPKPIATLTWIFIAAFFVIKIYTVAHNAYFDAGSRFDKRYSLNSELAQGVFTTKERSDIINSGLDALARYVKPGDHLFAYDNIPMIHFLTRTTPYLGNSWVWVYDANSLDQAIRQAQQRNKKLPVVMIQRFMTIGKFSSPIDQYLDPRRQNDYFWNDRRTQVMIDFLASNNYATVWSNPYFEIMLPNTVK